MSEKKLRKEEYGKQSRIGKRFFDGLEEIKNARLRSGIDKDRISTEKITNLISRHNSWKTISESIIHASKEEIDKYGI